MYEVLIVMANEHALSQVRVVAQHQVVDDRDLSGHVWCPLGSVSPAGQILQVQCRTRQAT